MTDKKISALTAATTPLAGTEVLPIVQSGITEQVTVANLTAGRDVSVKNLIATGAVAIGTSGTYSTGTIYSDANWGMLYTAAIAAPAQADYAWLTFAGAEIARIKNGNYVPSVAAKGINFTANTPAAGMTSQLLNWYEEGTFTPVLTGLTVSGTPTYTGKYTRVGRLVNIEVTIQSTVSTTSVNGTTTITGQPYACSNVGVCMASDFGSAVGYGTALVSTSTIFTPSWSARGNVVVTTTYSI